jgi:hypothetical protein
MIIPRLSVRVMLAGLLVASFTAACADDDPDEERGPAVVAEREATQSRAAPGQENVETHTIEIFDDRVTPQQLEIAASQPTRLQIENKSSSDCTFFMGNVVQGILVAAGQTVENSLSPLGGASSTAGTGNDTVEMGCQGDEERQGEAVIEFRGLAPQPGGGGGR